MSLPPDLLQRPDRDRGDRHRREHPGQPRRAEVAEPDDAEQDGDGRQQPQRRRDRPIGIERQGQPRQRLADKPEAVDDRLASRERRPERRRQRHELQPDDQQQQQQQDDQLPRRRREGDGTDWRPLPRR